MKYFNLELILLDKTGQTGINSVEALSHGLMYSEKLWNDPDVDKEEDLVTISDKENHLQVNIYPWDTSEILNDLVESAYRLHIVSDKFEVIERIRTRIIVHLKKRLEFTNIRLLTDDVSNYLCNQTYPLINEVENALRRYLVKFFIQKIGLDWWMVTAPKNLDEKIKFRKKYENPFSSMLDQDVNLIDFNELGELVYKQTTGFNNDYSIIDRIKNINSMSEFNELQDELEGNYNKYFKEAFQDNLFEKKWKALIEIRNKVAHNALLTLEDWHIADQLCSDLLEIIARAESRIETFEFNEKEKNVLRKASIEAAQEAEADEDDENSSDKLKKLGIKVVGQIDLDNIDERYNENKDKDKKKVITEKQMLEELEVAEEKLDNSELRYIGLKAFITKVLAHKGFAISPSYALINLMNDNDLIDIYDYEDEYTYYPVKAVRLKTHIATEST